MSETPIKDNSLLGTHGQTLCANLDVHWMTPTCDADSEERKCCKSVSKQAKVIDASNCRQMSNRQRRSVVVQFKRIVIARI